MKIVFENKIKKSKSSNLTAIFVGKCIKGDPHADTIEAGTRCSFDF